MSEKPLPAIESEVRKLTDTVHDLLNGPNGLGDDSFERETERIVLDIPKAWVVLASWLALKERQRRHGSFERSAFMRPDEPAHVHRHVRSWARQYLRWMIDNTLHMELHELSVGTHPYLYAPSPEPERPAQPDLDDDLPF